MTQHPSELTEIIEMVTGMFYYVKAQGDKAREFNICAGDVVGDTDETERALHQRLMEIGSKLMSEYFEQVGNGDEGYHAKFNGREYVRQHSDRPGSILTVFGPVEFRQCIYYDGSGESVRPFEAMANLPERNVTYFAQELMTRLGIEDTYASSQSFYADFFGHSPSSRTIEQVIQETATTYQAYDNAHVPMPEDPAGRIGVVSFDGKGVPVISSERTTGKTREALLGCTYVIEPEQRDAERLADSLVVPEILSEEEKKELHRESRAENIRYHASVAMPKDTLFKEVRDEAEVRFATANVIMVVCLMDGALKLWELAKKHFPNAVYILDLMHVLGYLRAAATALTKTPDAAQLLLAAYLRSILQGEVHGVIKSMRIRMAKNKFNKQQVDAIQAAITYFENHADYMRYDEYIKAGCPIATGVIESACKHIAKDRMSKAGAQWSITGAEAVLKLRCMRATGHWHEYHEIRREDERKELYHSHLRAVA